MTNGWGTKSWRNSTENRQLKDERAEITKKFEAGEIPRKEVEILVCECRSFQFPHSPERHKELRGDWDWTPWQKRRRSNFREDMKL